MWALQGKHMCLGPGAQHAPNAAYKVLHTGSLTRLGLEASAG